MRVSGELQWFRSLSAEIGGCVGWILSNILSHSCSVISVMVTAIHTCMLSLILRCVNEWIHQFSDKVVYSNITHKYCIMSTNCTWWQTILHCYSYIISFMHIIISYINRIILRIMDFVALQTWQLRGTFHYRAW